MDNIPNLFGLKYTNRDFSKKNSWGKNQFNSSFPASLCCYMHSKNLKANYFIIKNKEFKIHDIGFDELFGLDPNGDELFFNFETQFHEYSKLINNNIPRTDLVTSNRFNNNQIADLEIKLTALPDHTTATLGENLYGSEIVIRPDTIIYLVCSIIKNIQKSYFDPNIVNSLFSEDIWDNEKMIIKNFNKIKKFNADISSSIKNKPFLLQPIWKTVGKSSSLADNCFDVFVWSSSSFLFFINNLANSMPTTSINRHQRTLIWIVKMIFDFYKYKRINYQNIFDKLSFNTRNDKAFAVSGNITNKFMKCNNLLKPRIRKNELQNIILNGGEDFLSPERRLDAAICNSSLF